MIATSNPYMQYQKQGIMTASPGELVVKLYDGCIKFVQIAKLALEKGDPAGAHTAFIRAQDILTELSSSLDMNYAEISQPLFELYDFLLNELITANVSKDGAHLADCVEILTELREAWATIAKTNRNHVAELSET